MQLVHVVPHISAEASGPSYSVPRLCRSLAELGNGVTLSCLAASREIAGVDIQVHPTWPVAKSFAISPSHALALRGLARSVDIVHNHSLWSMVNVAAGWVVPGKRAKLVTSPRGTLSEWALANSKYKKLMVWPIQRQVLERAELLHATSAKEYEEIRNLGIKAPVLIVPNGYDLPAIDDRRRSPDLRDLLFLSRIHPVKGIELLLDAWARLGHRHQDWQLKIAGPGDSEYIAALKNRAHRLGLKRVSFAGPVYGAEKYAVFRNSDLFVLPTHSENFGMAVAEALSCECPAIVSQGAPWAGLERERCGWWIPNNVNSLSETLANAMSLSREELHQMGTRGRAWIERDFSWSKIALDVQAGYQWLLKGGVPPPFIRVD